MAMKKMPAKDLNFFAASERQYDENRANRNAVMILVIFVAVVSIAYPTISAYFKNAEAVKQIAGIQEYLSSGDTAAKLAQAQENLTVLSATRNYIAGVSSARSKFESLKKPTSRIFDTVASALSTDITVESVSYDNGLITVQCTSYDYHSAPEAVISLESTGSFAYVVYTGVSSNGDGTYSFGIQCACGEVAGQ